MQTLDNILLDLVCVKKKLVVVMMSSSRGKHDGAIQIHYTYLALKLSIFSTQTGTCYLRVDSTETLGIPLFFILHNALSKRLSIGPTLKINITARHTF